MKMIQGSGTIANYTNYISNCTLDQYRYLIPVPNLAAVQLYISLSGQPDTIGYELIHTCGGSGMVESLTAGSFVVGQDKANNWYGVFKNLSGASGLSSFVVAITVTIGGNDYIYFSEEYVVENSCIPLTHLKGCYGNLDPLLAFDCEGLYIGQHAGEGTALGDETVVYQHELYIRDGDFRLANVKNTFKQGRTRNFRTEKEKLYSFSGEFIPEWYLTELDAIFFRGEVFINNVKYLVASTDYLPIEECKRMWKPVATLKTSCYLSFTCEVDPCVVPTAEPEPCCDPLGVDANVTVGECCDPTDVSASVETGGS